MSKATLINGVKRALENPQTFRVPTGEEIASVEPGDFVKIGAEWTSKPGVNGERFWVMVITVKEDGKPWEGVIEQADMGYSHKHGYRHGTQVHFHPENILSIIK